MGSKYTLCAQYLHVHIFNTMIQMLVMFICGRTHRLLKSTTISHLFWLRHYVCVHVCLDTLVTISCVALHPALCSD